MKNKALIERAAAERRLSAAEWTELFATYTEADRAYAAALAQATARARFGNRVYTRGIVEFSNYCKNNCYYCGIRAGNREIVRYRLSEDEIFSCCENGYRLGFRTFVLQSGEDSYFDDERFCRIIRRIRAAFPDCAITLSVGEKSRAAYQAYFDAGADRYLLRHETADPEHYGMLHPAALSLANRLQCLRDLREIGYQTGAGMMVGTPWQEPRHLAADMVFLGEFRPEMVGIGPFIPHHQTPFRDHPAGSVPLTLLLMSMTRLILPSCLLPATTALGTAAADGRALGVQAGCNVVMPNLSPLNQRRNYLLYDNKLGVDDEAAESMRGLQEQMRKIGYECVVGRGDYIDLDNGDNGGQNE